MERRLKSFWEDPRVRWNRVASLLTAIAAYGYGMLNNITNYDSSYNNLTIGMGGEASGRWVLGILTRLTHRLHLAYSLPYFNILVSLILIWVSSLLLCRILRLSDWRSWGLMGVVTLSYPAVASMSFFSFTMVYYALALLLIVVACLLVERRAGLSRMLLYSILLALAAGIYQGFYPFAAMLAVLAMIRDCLDPAVAPKAVWKKGLKYVAAVLLSYAWYRLGLAATLAITGEKLIKYQGIRQMGRMELARLPEMIGQMYRHFFLLPTHDYLSLTVSRLSRICVLLLFVGAAGMLLLGWREKNRWKRVEMAALILLALPLASNLIILMVPKGTVYTLMGMGLLSIFYLPLLLWDNLRFPKPKLRRLFGLGLGSVLFLSSLMYVYQSNGCFRLLEWRNIQAENYFTILFTRIKSMPGYRAEDEVVFAGDVITDESYSNPWSDTLFQYGGMLQFDSKDPLNNPFNEFSRNRFISFRLGYTPRDISKEERARYDSVLQQMSCYPNDGSICIVDGLVLVRFE